MGKRTYTIDRSKGSYLIIILFGIGIDLALVYSIRYIFDIPYITKKTLLVFCIMAIGPLIMIFLYRNNLLCNRIINWLSQWF
jgi:hypothetical protein